MSLHDLIKGNIKKHQPKNQAPVFYSRPGEASYTSPKTNYSSPSTNWNICSTKYFKGLEEIEAMWSVMYNLKIYSGEKADIFEKKCKQNIIDLHNYISASTRNGHHDSVPFHVPAYVRLAMLYEKQEKYEQAINVCVEAIKLGATHDDSKGKMYGRLARLIRKSGLTVNDDILKLASKAK